MRERGMKDIEVHPQRSSMQTSKPVEVWQNGRSAQQRKNVSVADALLGMVNVDLLFLLLLSLQRDRGVTLTGQGRCTTGVHKEKLKQNLRHYKLL
jgi:hypothetical protein